MGGSARRILCVSYGGGHIAMVLPVIEALRARHPDWRIELMALTTALHSAKARGFDGFGYRRFSHWYGDAQLREHAAPLLEATQHAAVDPQETVAYLGINFAELKARLGAEEATRRYAKEGRWALYPVEFMGRVLDELMPDLVLTTNSPRSEAAVIEAAARRGIPSVCMVDLFSPVGDPFLDRGLYADALTTINALGKRNLVAGGVPAERVHITGSPAFDALGSPARKAEAAAERKRLGWDGKRIILWAGNMEAFLPATGPMSDPFHLPHEVERILREFVRGNPDAALLIRYHPNQVQRFDAGAPQERVLWSDPLARAAHLDIEMADIVVVNGSTIGLEAAIAGKSVLSMDNSPSKHVFPLSDFGVSRGVPSFEALAPMVRAAMDSPHASAFAGEPGAAAAGVAGVIESLLAD